MFEPYNHTIDTNSGGICMTAEGSSHTYKQVMPHPMTTVNKQTDRNKI
jgi:hypothetical protein